MKIKLLGLLVAMTVPCSLMAAPADSFESIVGSTHYKKVVAESKKNRASFGCAGVTEKIESRDYATLPGETSTFKLVILDCFLNPHDGGDAIRQAGLAVVSHGEVVSFSLGRIAQPD